MEDLVAFTEEWELGRRYLKNQRERYGERLRFDMRILGRPLDERIPPLTLQPLLENAIQHGLGPRSGAGRILVRVRFHRTAAGDSRWWMVVRDDGVGPAPLRSRVQPEASGNRGPAIADSSALYMGETLSNIRVRLEHLLDGGGLWIRPASAGGTVAVLTGGPPRETPVSNFGESLS